MTNLATLADDYAALDAQIKAITKARDAIKAEILATGETVIHGAKAIVKISESFPVTFSKELAETLLSPEDFRRCHATAIKPTLRLTVSATQKAFA
jgi:hypothetical protein